MNSFLRFLPGLVIGLTLHEYAHARVAVRLGDRSPILAGRTSINPFAHLSPAGLLALFFFDFGWARPVQVNPYNFANPKRDLFLVAVAGPAANAILAVFLAGVFAMSTGTLAELAFNAGLINVFLAVFNLLPIPPLDGSRILGVVAPRVRISNGLSATLAVALVLAIRWGWLSSLFRFVGTQYAQFMSFLRAIAGV